MKTELPNCRPSNMNRRRTVPEGRFAIEVEAGCKWSTINMQQFLPDPLDEEEFFALRQIAMGFSQNIAVHIQNRLKLSGYVTEIAKGLVVTIEGQMRLAASK